MNQGPQLQDLRQLHPVFGNALQQVAELVEFGVRERPGEIFSNELIEVHHRVLQSKEAYEASCVRGRS